MLKLRMKVFICIVQNLWQKGKVVKVNIVAIKTGKDEKQYNPDT